MPDYVATFQHDPDAHLDYAFDWSWWLPKFPRDIVTAATLTASHDRAVLSPPTISANGTKVNFYVTTDQSTAITCHVVTRAGREDDRTMYLEVEDR